MKGEQQMYTKIMVPLDGSSLAECVLPHVETLAKSPGVEKVIFVRVAEPFELTPVRGEQAWFSEEDVKNIDARTKAVAKEYVDQIARQVNYGPVTVQTEVLMGKSAPLLAEYANKNGVDLVVISTHGRSGVGRWMMGSVADRLMRSVNAPVLMVRAPGCAVA
jgi:nucleotide-binding universal stress UspA family protein